LCRESCIRFRLSEMATHCWTKGCCSLLYADLARYSFMNPKLKHFAIYCSYDVQCRFRLYVPLRPLAANH
jgi:hypothetical protein